MRKIISGKVYDTETATILALNPQTWNGTSWTRSGDPLVLYATPRGLFFKHHSKFEGGELDTITPLNRDKAVELFNKLPDKNLEEYAKCFKISESTDGYNFQLRNIPASIHAKIKAAAEQSGKSMQEILRSLVIDTYKEKK